LLILQNGEPLYAASTIQDKLKEAANAEGHQFISGTPSYHILMTDRMMPDSMHADTNQLQRDLEMMNSLASSIDYFNGKRFSAVGSLSEQQDSAQRSFWNAFRDVRVRSQLGHVAERMENKLAAERASHLNIKVADAELKPTEYRFVCVALFGYVCCLVSYIYCRLQVNRGSVDRGHEKIQHYYAATMGGAVWRT
jgi:hypothetical protein